MMFMYMYMYMYMYKFLFSRYFFIIKNVIKLIYELGIFMYVNKRI